MSNILRHIARNKCKQAMKDLGMRQFCKRDHARSGSFTFRVDSYFSQNWRDFLPATLKVKK